MLHLSTFGGLQIERDGQPIQLPTHKARELLAYLLTFRDRPHPRLVLAGVLWPDLPEDKARRRLSDTLWRVRRAVGNYVEADEGHLWFNAQLPHWLDMEEFQTAVSESTTGKSAPESVERALALYRGPFLEGFYHDWVLLERERLRGMYLEALWLLLEHHIGTADYAASLAVAQQLVGAEPLHEAAHRELMRLYHLLGRDAEAVAQYHRCRESLRTGLGVDPAPETDELFHTLSRRTELPPESAPTYLPEPSRRPLLDLDALPMVGRDAERAILLGHLEAAVAGRGGLILLEGEPGIGKSRLVQEIGAGAHWRNVGTIVVSAQESRISSYALIADALRSALPPLRLRQLMSVVDPAQLQAAAPLLPPITDISADLPPLPDLDPPRARERLQEALVALIVGLAHIAPRLWVLEDLQWADAETLAFLSLMRPHLEDSRTLFLLTGRSAEMRAAPAVWEALQALDRERALPRYTLNRLDTEAIGQLVGMLLGKNDPALTEHLARESEGVPLYLVESLKTWRDEGYLQPGELGTWTWRGEKPAALPSHLGEGVIRHRLDRLSPASEEILTAAAVIGLDVDYDILTRVCAPAEPVSDLEGSGSYLLATNDLLRLGLLVETDSGYSFSHERVRRAVYGRLGPVQRRDLHHRVAQAVESVFPEQFDLLAHHYTATDNRERAIHYISRAAERARELFAHQATLAYYDRLLELLSQSGDRAARYDVLSSRAEILGWAGERAAQGQAIDEMIRLAEDLEDDQHLGLAYHRRSEFHRIQGQYQAAMEDAHAAIDIFRRVGDDSTRAGLLTQLGWNVIYTADHPKAFDYFQEALPIHRQLGNLRGQISCLSGLAAIAQLAGDYVAALSHLEENMALAKVSGDPVRIGRAVHNTATVYLDLGDLETAENYLRSALETKERVGDLRSQAITHFYLGETLAEREELAVSESHYSTALTMFREVEDSSWEGDTLAGLGRLKLLQGDISTAEEHLATAHQIRRDLGEPSYAVVDLSYLALTEIGLGKENDGWQHSQEAVSELEGLSGVEHLQRIYYNHYRVAEATRRWAAARTALEKANQVVKERAELIDDPKLCDRFLTGLVVNRDISEAVASLPKEGCLTVQLARIDAPTHRRPTPEEMVSVIWTVDAGAEDAAMAEGEGKVGLRRHRILRLLAEAEAAAGLPTVADLAGALDVSPRTVRGDLAALRDAGHTVSTRGAR
jgi:predicted ATPase/DNA-binding SARP family transcriptional activator/DNA-binding transcriptional ArsR family regulator